MRRIFLSYNLDRDRFFAKRLRRALEDSARVDVIDPATSESSGEQFPQVLSQIQSASLFIAVLSATDSNVLLETGIALGAGKQILVVGGASEFLPGELRSLPYISQSEDIEADVASVLRRLESFNIEEERSRDSYTTVIQKLRTYVEDPKYFDSMSPEEFEGLIIQWFQEQGYSTGRPDASHKFGVDLVATSPSDNSTLVVEVKKFTRQSRVSMRDIMALLGAATYFKAATAVLITSSSFTRASLEMAAVTQNPRLRLLTMEELLQAQNLIDLLH